MDLSIHRAARAEARAAAVWYGERDELVANRFTAELSRVLMEIGAHPERWPCYRSDVRRCHLRGFPYAVLYRIFGDRVRVIAVAHASRAPDFWSERR